MPEQGLRRAHHTASHPPPPPPNTEAGPRLFGDRRGLVLMYTRSRRSACARGLAAGVDVLIGHRKRLPNLLRKRFGHRQRLGSGVIEPEQGLPFEGMHTCVMEDTREVPWPTRHPPP